MGSDMKLPPEFNSWGEVWDEHQLRGKQVRELSARLAACEEALRFAAHVLNNQVLKADSVLFQDAKNKVNAALKEPSRG